MKRIAKLTLLFGLFAVLLSTAPVKAMEEKPEAEEEETEMIEEEQMPEE